MSEPKPDGKPFAISKRVVWEACRRVKANDGAEGVDGQSIQAFEENLRGNLYKVWNPLTSGSYIPPPVRAVEIPKKDRAWVENAWGADCRGQGRSDGCVPVFGAEVEPIFHPDSYGYRPRRSAHRCAADMSGAVLEVRLGSRFGSQVVLRLARSLAGSEIGRSPHEPAVDPPLRGAMAESPAGTRGRHPSATGAWESAGLGDLARLGEHLPALRAGRVAWPGVFGGPV